ncbi:carbamoyl phosphate synthase small subunit [Caldalkalibacillus salinus]|uniref:carbamoyl phosphate synthase small subunit n=1 Tax=Caldalkalibacillus salinus TaxID=2803787 RepID=UPI0019243303|nr:carbamoyl phosphate synthase small subunit [Caldalkalibacillus salinus]
MTKTGFVILEDGHILEGKSFGAEKKAFGEVVFNTSMSGYQEVLSDPSYCGQIVTMTYPLMGNYGVNRDDFESLDPAIHGLIVKEQAQQPSNWRSEGSLSELLASRGIPGLYDVDTRQLTKIIRKHGAMKGMMATGIERKDIPQYLEQIRSTSLTTDQVAQVSTKNAFHCPGTKDRIVLIDYGCKAGILRELTDRHCDVRVVPYDTHAEDILKLRPDGVLLSNGPGNPKHVPQAVETVRALVGQVPLFGICLGHQLFALACGADTHKLTFGHRGANHPVKDLQTNKIMMTSQNHGYAVARDSLKQTPLEVTQLAVNDGTVEGLKHKEAPAFSVQYHPEASPGPFDSQAHFDQFLAMIEEHQNRKTSHYTPNFQVSKGEKDYATIS